MVDEGLLREVMEDAEATGLSSGAIIADMAPDPGLHEGGPVSLTQKKLCPLAVWLNG